MKVHVRHGLLAAVLFALAGCADAAEPQASPTLQGVATATFDEQTGAIEGTVLSEDELPIEGAQVGILALDLVTITDAAGEFVFSNLEPGTYAIVASHLGYEPATQRAEVRAGEVSTVTLALVAAQVEAAYSEVWTDRGFFECSTRTLISSGPCFFPGPQIPAPNNKRAWNYGTDPGVMTVVNEIEWQANSLATGNSLRITFSYANRTTSHWYCDAEGPNPLMMRWDREAGCVSGGNQLPSDEPQEIPEEGQELRSFINSGRANEPVGTTGFGATFQQSFDLTVSVFYWEPAPDDYTGLED